MNNNEACAEYFRGNSAYRRCFSEFEKKWKTYGKVTGIITLKNTSEEERRAIGGILGKTFYENTIRFPFAEFEKGLQYTKFAPVDFEQVLEAYFGRKMLTTQERQKEAERGKADFFEQRGLNGRRQHDGRLVFVLFQAVQQIRCEAKVALHEIFRVFRTIHTCQIEHKVCFPAVLVQLRRGRIQIILVDFFNIQCRAGLIFPIPDVFQVVAQGGSHHALGTCD